MSNASNGPVGNWRWRICALLFFATTINYMDRQVLGLLAPTLQKDIGWTESQYAHVIVAFQAAYAIGLLAFGRWIDVVGTKKGYTVAVIFWSVAAASHALVRSVSGFGAARFALGLGEAGNFPAAVKAVAEWFPRRERALANGIFNSGCNVGAVLAPLVVPWMAARWGWQVPFIVLGALGFVWLVFWLPLFDTPEKSRHVSPQELAHIRSDPSEAPLENISWGRLLAHRQTWAFIAGYAFTAPIWWFYLYWLTKFLNKQYGLELTKLGPPLVVIYSMTCFGSIVHCFLPLIVDVHMPAAKGKVQVLT